MAGESRRKRRRTQSVFRCMRAARARREREESPKGTDQDKRKLLQFVFGIISQEKSS